MSEYKTNYDPFWTEQTTKITTTNQPKESDVIVKYADDGKLFIYAFLVLFIVIFISLTADNYYKTHQELEFAKAGLVQKVEDGKVIWTKP